MGRLSKWLPPLVGSDRFAERCRFDEGQDLLLLSSQPTESWRLVEEGRVPLVWPDDLNCKISRGRIEPERRVICRPQLRRGANRLVKRLMPLDPHLERRERDKPGRLLVMRP